MFTLNRATTGFARAARATLRRVSCPEKNFARSLARTGRSTALPTIAPPLTTLTSNNFHASPAAFRVEAQTSASVCETGLVVELTSETRVGLAAVLENPTDNPTAFGMPMGMLALLMFGAFGAGSVACVGEDDDDPAAVAAAEAAFDAECNALDDAALKQSTRDARQILLPR